ncbi:MAG: VOC family protein [Pseudomonadota bacterium]
MGIAYYHVMQRAKDLDKTIRFYELLGMAERRRYDSEAGRFTNVFMSPDGSADGNIELTYNWDDDPGLPADGRHFGHIAFIVDDIYTLCQHLMDHGVTINRPPRDGYMAFVRSPDNISIELLQKGDALAPQEPWASMENTGHW